MHNRIAELSVLYEIASLEFKDSVEHLFEELTEKTSRIFGARRIILILEEGSKNRQSQTWCFPRFSPVDGSDYVDRNRSSPEAYLQRIARQDRLSTLYLEKKDGFDIQEIRLLDILSKRLTEVLEVHYWQEEVRRANERLRWVIENSPMVAVFGFNREGTLTHWNREAQRLFGIGTQGDQQAVELMRGIQPATLLEDTLREVWMTGAASPPLEWSLNNEQGTDCWILMTLIPGKGGGGVNEVFCMAVDITDRKRAEKLLQQKSSELEAVFQALPDLFFRFDQEGAILDYYAGTHSDPYVPPESFMQRNVREFLPSDVAEQWKRTIKQVLLTQSMDVVEYSLLINNEEQFYEARWLPLLNDQVVAVVRNITKRKQADDRLRYLSIHDPLTGLYNRAYFEEELRRIERSRHKSVGLIVCDVDGLKLINDTIGHAAGDELLITVSKIIKSCFREDDVVARIGGDEFAVLLANVTGPVVERACGQITEAIIHHNQSHADFPLSVSVGFAIGSREPLDMANLFREADDNMYREKLHRSRSARSAIVQTLMKALEARDFITEGHADRLQELVTILAKALHLPERTVTDLRLLAQFHDLGKVGIPDRILFKPGPLTPQETIEMRRHCEIGHRIALSSPDLVPIADWILKHHEWWNGQGYPLRLSGEEIPLECRILAIADAYDAMTSDRPYRQRRSYAKAVAELKRCSGTQFDPRLVRKFVNALKKTGVAHIFTAKQ